MDVKKALFIVTRAPYGREESFGAILFAGTGAAAEVQSIVVFTCDGVQNAVKGQNPANYFRLGENILGLPSIERIIGDMSQAGVEFYVLRRDIEARGISEGDLIEGVRPIMEDGLTKLMLEADTSLVF